MMILQKFFSGPKYKCLRGAYLYTSRNLSELLSVHAHITLDNLSQVFAINWNSPWTDEFTRTTSNTFLSINKHEAILYFECFSWTHLLAGSVFAVSTTKWDWDSMIAIYEA
jgi:hypothetical protein